MGKGGGAYFADPLLVQRVRSIIEDLELKNPSEVTVVHELSRKHREYVRKPQNQLKRSVSKAIRVVLASSKKDESNAESGGKRRRSPSTTPDSPLNKKVSVDSSDEELDPNIKLVKVEDRNSLNKRLVSSYKNKSESAKPTKSEGQNKPQRKKSGNPYASSAKQVTASSRPKQRFEDIGGIESCIQEVRELCEYPLLHPEIYAHLGVEPPRGILLHGPPGCGKTLLANAIAGELNVPFFKVAAPEIVSGMSGESEEKLRNLFEEAKLSAPSILFIDEIDAITAKRESTSRGMEKRIVAQLLTCMDSLSTFGEGKSHSKKGEDASEETESTEVPKTVIVIGATNHPDALDSALRRAGRFDREIALGIPDEVARLHILKTMTKKLKLSGDFDFKVIAKRTPGYVGADLAALTKEAAVVSINRIFGKIISNDDTTPKETSDIDVRMNVSEILRSQDPLTDEQLAPLCITMDDFEIAVTKVQPSSKREGFATVPSVTWDDVGALTLAREQLFLAITAPINFSHQFDRMGLSVPAGVLLYGPPGCGKTLLAKAVANSSGANFISIKGPELLNKYVGESEKAVRDVFARARSSSPCVVFFDELDALCPRRGQSENGVNERVVNQLLTEMDGLESRKSVFVIAATNRPDIIDPAMLRPGRLDRLVFVPLPSPEDRLSILTTCVRNTPLSDKICLPSIANNNALTGFSGADIASLVREACICALKRGGLGTTDADTVVVEEIDFVSAMKKIVPSVSKHDEKLYNSMQKRLRSARGHLEEDTQNEDS